MFGHGNKTPTPPPAPWALQFVTTDYLVAGSVQPKDYAYSGTNLFAEAAVTLGVAAFKFLALENVRWQPAGGLASAPETLPQLNLGFCDNLIAIIPDDAASLAMAQQAFKEYRQPQAGVFYVGPYLIAGTYLGNPDALSYPFVNEKSVRPLVDAEISCRLPGSTLQNWRVPWLLLNGRQLHAFQLR
jgi:hypothetical protein